MRIIMRIQLHCYIYDASAYAHMSISFFRVLASVTTFHTLAVMFSLLLLLFILLQDERLWFSSAVVCAPSNNLSETVNQCTAFANGYYTILHKYHATRWHLKCFRGSCIRQKSRTSGQQYQSKRPENKHTTCKFYIPVQYCTEHNLFFLRKNGGCNFTHNGHLVQERELMKMGIKQIPDDIRNDAEEMLSRHVPTAIVAQVVKIRSKNYLTNDALKHLRRIALSEKVNSTKSAAELTLDILRQEKGCNYSYIIGSLDHAKSLITIRKGSWKMPKSNTASSLNEEIKDEIMCANDLDERTRYTNSLLRGLSVGKNFFRFVYTLNKHIFTMRLLSFSQCNT